MKKCGEGMHWELEVPCVTVGNRCYVPVQNYEQRITDVDCVYEH